MECSSPIAEIDASNSITKMASAKTPISAGGSHQAKITHKINVIP